VQPDMKKLVAYSSVSHLGFCVLGIFALNQTSVEGSILQMVSHGLSTGALFLLVGVIYDRRHTRMMADFGGLAKSMPIYATIFVIVALSSAGLPGLNGFIGEFMVLSGTFKTMPWYAVVAASGVIIAAIYLLWLVQRVFFGALDKEENRNLPDIAWNELLAVAPILVFIVWIGIYPNTFLRPMTPSVHQLLATVEASRTAGTAVAEAPPEGTVAAGAPRDNTETGVTR
jgi:NADH-quinone oxidoreductase subunit M